LFWEIKVQIYVESKDYFKIANMTSSELNVLPSDIISIVFGVLSCTSIKILIAIVFIIKKVSHNS
jgi:hypothetical protein